MSRQTPDAQRQGGFSLIELLLAVTMLALLGSTVLRVFLASHELNRQAALLDRAVWLNVDAVERLKALHPSEGLTGSRLMELFPEATLTAGEQGWQLTLLLDADFQPFLPAGSGKPGLAWRMNLEPDPVSGGLSSMVTATVFAVPEKEQDAPDEVHVLTAALPGRCVGEEVAQP